MNYEYIQLKVAENIATVTINRPDALNALNDQVLDELKSIFLAINENPEVKVVVITGVGKSFVAGADIATMQPMTYKQGKEYGVKGSSVFRVIETTKVPVIAAINGFALGGGNELMLSCDIALASQKAKFGQPEVGLGITPGFAGTQRLSRIVGARIAKELIFTGRIINAEEALRIGLINKIVPPSELMEESIAIARTITNMAPLAIQYAKAAINEGLQTDIIKGVEIENEYFGKCFATSDQSEGMNAFLEKRKANFQGK